MASRDLMLGDTWLQVIIIVIISISLYGVFVRWQVLILERFRNFQSLLNVTEG